MSAFPDARWGSERNPLRRPLVAFASTRPGSWLIRTLTPLDRWLLVHSKGRYTVLGPVGAPVLLLTTTGSRSGQPRTTPLLHLREGDRLYVIGSNFGQGAHPAWSGNLLAHPAATVTIGGRDVPAVATPLEGGERERVWAMFVAFASTYEAYRDRTSRELRIFALDPA